MGGVGYRRAKSTSCCEPLETDGVFGCPQRTIGSSCLIKKVGDIHHVPRLARRLLEGDLVRYSRLDQSTRQAEVLTSTTHRGGWNIPRQSNKCNFSSIDHVLILTLNALLQI